jgi:hypothetical protein
VETFDRHHVSFVSVTQLINTSTSMGRLMLNVLLSFAQFEREIISERTRDKIAAARRRGKWSGGMPLLGYDVDAKGGKLLVNQSEAERVAHVSAGGAGWPGTDTWQQVQALLQRNGRTGGALVRNKFGAFLKGILRCKPCGCAMTPSHSTRGNKRYRYYCCLTAQKRGWHNCPSKSIPAGEIERFVVDQIRAIGRDPAVLQATITQARLQAETQLAELEAERRGLERDVSRWTNEVRQTVAQSPLAATDATTARLADLQERIRLAELRANDIRLEATTIGHGLVDEREVAEALAEFDDVWQALTPREQTRFVQLLIERVEYDGTTGDVAITFHPTGIRALTERRTSQEDAA